MFILPWRTVPDLNTPNDEAYKQASDLIVRTHNEELGLNSRRKEIS